MWRLDFQTGFNFDTITLMVDDKIIIEDCVLKTESTTYFTGLSITCYTGFLFPKIFHVRGLERNEVFSLDLPSSDEITFKIIINSSDKAQKIEGELQVDFNKGKFIGVSKHYTKENPLIYIISQRNSVPLYY